MKNLIKILISLSMLITVSCESDLTKINENPNDPANVDPKFLLTYVSRDIFQVDNSNLYSSRMMIDISGESPYQYMKWNDASFSSYSSILLNVSKMMAEGERINNPNYKAIGKLYRSIVFYQLTLNFGDIPYSEAIKGEEKITQPKFDTQEDVFKGILTELKEANDLVGTGQPIDGDIIYNGNMAQWKKLINSFRLKVLISLSKKSRVGDISVASEFANIANTQPIMQSIDDDGALKFYDVADSRYTYFNDSGYGSSVYIADYFVNLFKERKDPRLFTFAEQTTGAKEAGKAITDFTSYNGGNPVSPYSDNAALVTAKNISKINTRYYLDAVNEPSSILSYSELEFILAEAAARGWIASTAKGHYENAIKANFNFYKKYVTNQQNYFSGFNVNDYLNQNLVKFDASQSLNNQLQRIMTQKYMTMFHQSQWTSYFDYLRTGYPEFPLPKGMSTAPKRFLYPQTEYNYNGANLKEALNRQYNGKDDIHETPWWLK